MLDQITTEQFSEWVAYFRCEPFGERWLQTSYVCSMINNIMATKESDRIEMDYFLPEFAREKKKPISTAQDKTEMAKRYTR